MSVLKFEVTVHSALAEADALNVFAKAVQEGLETQRGLIFEAVKRVTETEPTLSLIDGRMAAVMLMVREMGGVGPSTGVWQIGLAAQKAAKLPVPLIPTGRGVWYALIERMKHRGLLRDIGNGLAIGYDELRNDWVFRYGRPSQYVAFTPLGERLAASVETMLIDEAFATYKGAITPAIQSMMGMAKIVAASKPAQPDAEQSDSTLPGTEEVPARAPRAPRTPK